jgi:starch phosphorylase
LNTVFEPQPSTLTEDVARHYALTLGRDNSPGDHHYLYEALALSLRDRLVGQWRATRERFRESGTKQVAYLSMEFLVGRSLHNALLVAGA